jgi:hypothetical protein
MGKTAIYIEELSHFQAPMVYFPMIFPFYVTGKSWDNTS